MGNQPWRPHSNGNVFAQGPIQVNATSCATCIQSASARLPVEEDC